MSQRPRLIDYIRPTGEDAAMFELVDPATDEALDMSSLQPYSAMQNDERLQRGRAFWQRCSRVMGLVVVCGRHQMASDLGEPGEFEQLLAGAKLFGFEGVGASDSVHSQMLADSRNRLRLSGFQLREAQAVQKSGVTPFCYDVAPPEQGTPGYDLDVQIKQVQKLGDMKVSNPTPREMTTEERAQWILASDFMRNCFMFDCLGYRIDDLTDGQGASTVVTIGSGHRRFMESRLVAYGVDAPLREYAPPPPVSGIFEGVHETGQISAAAIGELAAYFH